MEGIFRPRITNLLIILLMIVLTGCSGRGVEEAQTDETIIAVDDSTEFLDDNGEGITHICLELYKNAAEGNQLDDYEMVRCIVNRFGENGYAAVDSKNQINMTNCESVEVFCEKVAAKEEAELTIIQVGYVGDFARYDLNTQYGQVNVVKTYYQYQEGNMERRFVGSYDASNFKYTDEGYIMFSGMMYSEQQYVLTMSNAEEHVAFRVQPLDEACREMCRKYLSPVSFQRNNMFIIDWNEKDYGKLNFYDMYDVFYPQVYECCIPYMPDNNLQIGKIYEIPREEFESVIMTYFDIDSELLQSKTTYNSVNETYEYKPRGFYESEYPEYPYSEVVAFSENEDGTITLTANVVYPYIGDSKIYVHQVVIRPLANGEIQYVSNQILTPGDSYEESWHTPRLTQEEWDDIYGEHKEVDTQWEKGYNLPVNPLEEEAAISDCNEAMRSICDIYENSNKELSTNDVLDDETINQIQEIIGGSDTPVIASAHYSAMENYELVDAFLKACLDGKAGSLTIYEIHNDGGLTRKKFLYDGRDMYLICAIAGWNDKEEPVISYLSYNRIKEWKYTDKGWFGYELCVPEPPEVSETMDGSCLIRVIPMGDEHRQLSEKCVLTIGYHGNNLLCTNWDLDNIERLDYNGLFEYFYELKYGEQFDSAAFPDGIPKDEFEKVIMYYLPVNSEQIRKWASYDEEKQTYNWVQLGCSNYSPSFFGTSVPEVTNIRENEDGTITLTVDAVCDMVICDDAVITHELTVRFAEDGTFQYLGNEILDNGIEDIPAYQYRVDDR